MIETHEVVNQVPAREGVDEYAANVPLVEAVARWGSDGGAAASGLHDVGALVGSAAFQRDAERANTHPPVLHAHDRWGNRVDEVEYDDAYHRIIAAAVGAGAHTSAWARSGSRRERRPRRGVLPLRAGRAGARLPGVDDARGRAGARARGIRPSRPVDAAAALREYDPDSAALA